MKFSFTSGILAPMWHNYFQKTLNDRFKQWRTPKGLSLRNYAKKLGISPGTFSDIAGAKRVISFERALKIAEAAEFTTSQIDRMTTLYKVDLKKKSEVTLTGKDAEIILNPIYYLTICAVEILPNPTTNVEIATALNRTEKEIDPIISKLVQLEIFSQDGEAISWTGRYASTTEDIPSEKIQRFFKQTIATSMEGLSLPVDQREYTTVTFTGNISEMDLAKHQIRKFRDSFPKAMKGKNPDQIFELSIQLRPVSNQVKGKK